MANYLPQPDSVGTCCDCPTRTNPCDSCGCIATITIRFSGLVTPCCVTALGPSVFSLKLTNNDLNDRDIVLSLEPTFACSAGQCFWDVTESPAVPVLHRYSDMGCVTQLNESTESNHVIVGFLGGIYYIFGFVGFGDIGMFYAESASIASPIANSFTSCSAALDDVTIDNAFTDCWNGEPLITSKFAYSGTVQITL